MDDVSKDQFRWRFWYLAAILNGVILFFALFIIAIALFPEPFKIPGAAISLILAVLLTILFRKRYKTTKKWLDEHA